MEEVGQVLEVSGGSARVKMNRTAACVQCGQCGLAALQQNEDIVVDAHNHANAEPGDWVRVEMESRQFLAAAFVVFIFPLVAAVLGYLLGSLLAPQMGVSSGAAGTVTAILVFLASYSGIRAYDRRAESRGAMRPVIVEVFDGPESGGAGGR